MEIEKVLLMPDSFKGTMSSLEVCRIMGAQIEKHFPAAEIVYVPIADGGEGTAECFLGAMPGERIPVKVKGPFLDEDDMDAWYALINGGRTAVVELAVCAGLPLVEGRKDPRLTTTYGVGQLMLHAAGAGAEEIIVAIGGSCTNDGGCGCASALGVRFIDKDGNDFVPTGGSLSDISGIDMSGFDASLQKVKLSVMCDVDNPLYGENGAAYIFGPQKGADAEMVVLLDDGLKNLASKIVTATGMDVSAMPGAGAAGGIGGGLAAFAGATLKPGIRTVLDTIGFENMAKGSSLILTGEGKIDSQSLRGKVVVGVAERAKKLNIPVIAVVGDIGEGYEKVYTMGVTAVVSTNRVAIPFEDARLRAKEDLAKTVDGLMRILRLGRSGEN